VTASRRPPPRLPRWVYWALGAVIAFAGAVVARLFADRTPDEYRLVIWFMGGAFIFLGVAVLSLGTRSRLDGENTEEDA
jgi:H+/Cl- antiporter ClcA